MRENLRSEIGKFVADNCTWVYGLRRAAEAIVLLDKLEIIETAHTSRDEVIALLAANVSAHVIKHELDMLILVEDSQKMYDRFLKLCSFMGIEV